MTVGDFERACAETERAAAEAVKAASALSKAAKRLEKAAQLGSIGDIRKAAEAVRQIDQTARAEMRNAILAWPLSPEQELEFLQGEYVTELLEAAAIDGLKMAIQDGNIIAYPLVIRVMPESRAVKVDKASVTALRPAHLVKQLKVQQLKKPRYKPEAFIEALHNAYRLVVGSQGVQGTTVLAAYQAFTLLPGSSKEYSKSDFARDLYALQSSSVDTTKSGAQVSLPASTGTKGSSQLITFIGRDGAPVVYYGITFVETVK